MKHPSLPALCLLCLAACGVTYTPLPDRPFEPIANEFTSSHHLTLHNAQPSKEVVHSSRWLIDYNAWTDVAITIAERELVKRGMTVGEGAAKSLALSVQSATTESGFVKIESVITMQVTTGDGYTATYSGINSSTLMANTYRQIDGAMMRVVVQMLSDPRIVEYLTR